MKFLHTQMPRPGCEASHYSCILLVCLNPCTPMIAWGLWMTGLSVEETLELWASSLRAAKARMRPLFTQARVAASAERFLDGLLGEERRKTGWMRVPRPGFETALCAGHATSLNLVAALVSRAFCSARI